MRKIGESRILWVAAVAVTLGFVALPGCPAVRKVIAVPLNAIALVINADPTEGILAAGQSAWYKFSEEAGKTYTVSVDSNPGAGSDAGIGALSQSYYEKVTDSLGNAMLQSVTVAMKSAAIVYAQAERECYVQLTNDYPEGMTADVNYTIAATLRPDAVTEGEAPVELKVAESPDRVEYVQATLHSSVATWFRFTGVQGGNLHLAVLGDAKIMAAYASDRQTAVTVDAASLLNVLDLPGDGEYFLALGTDAGSSVVQAGLVLVSVNPASFADIKTEWTPASPAVETNLVLLKEADTWVKFTGIEGQNLFAGSKDGKVTATAYRSDLVTKIDLNNIPANDSYALALRAAADPYLVAPAGLEWVSATPFSAADVNKELVVQNGADTLLYAPVILTANGSTWVKFYVGGAQGAFLQFASRPGTVQLSAVFRDGDLTNPVDPHSLTGTGYFLGQLRSASEAARTEAEVALYW